jgi:HAE1 family hydrophobic/amphiphilic exporter-1
LQKIAEGVEGVKSVSSLAGYEILTEGTVLMQVLV